MDRCRLISSAAVLVGWLSATAAVAQDVATDGAPKNQSVLLQADFSADPQWDGFRNRLLPQQLPIVRQEFGYRTSNKAGGQAAGEVGGTIERSTTPASYARVISECTLDDRLHASGRFSVTRAEGGSGVMFGWFHHTSRGWRTPNSLAFRIDGNGGKYWVFYEYGTASGRTGGGGAFAGERYQTTETEPFPADGASHEWSLDYDPTAADGHGRLRFQIDDRTYEVPLADGHKQDAATFDRFGFWNVQTEGGSLDVFIDDLTVNGETLTFDTNPDWQAVGNDGTFTEHVIRPLHDFGYSPTQHAGGRSPGEIGGIIFRDEKPTYYGAPIAPLSLDDELFASGRVALHAAASDSGVYLGWFSADAKQAKQSPEHEERQTNYLAIMIEGPSRVGHYFRPGYGTATGLGGTSGPSSGAEPPVIHPNGESHKWWIHYSPEAADGNGRIVVGFDDQQFTYDLLPGHRRDGATFDRFGLFNIQSGGHHVRVYVDDLRITTAAGTRD